MYIYVLETSNLITAQNSSNVSILIVSNLQTLASEAVQGASLALQGVDDVHRSHGLSARVLGVSNRVADHVLKENFQHTTRLFVDQARDALHTSTASEATDGWLGDALDVVAQHLTMTLSAAFAQSFSTFSTARHLRFSFFCFLERFSFVVCVCCLRLFSGARLLSSNP